MKQLATYFAYPMTFILAFLLFDLLAPFTSLLVRTYFAVFFGIAVIIVMERLLPFREEWHPPWREFIDDASYALLVQVLLPRILAIAVALLLASQIEYAASFWPHESPLFVQLVLMLLVADFLRYWLHRASHTLPVLWRLHEVHHSVQKLYWLNTSRFHPIEKTLQFLFDALPFILLGVSQEVIATYFVFYAINGFYQHSNADVRLGFLNYLVSGPQLHRWHHSRTIKESNSNYGNNLIVWDVLFRTRFLPDDRSVKQLGIHQEQYPESFLGQLFAPFRRRG